VKGGTDSGDRTNGMEVYLFIRFREEFSKGITIAEKKKVFEEMQGKIPN